jgi:hypothetical protein
VDWKHPLLLVIADKLVFALVVGGATFALNRALERFKAARTKDIGLQLAEYNNQRTLALETFKIEQAHKIEALRSDLAQKLELFKGDLAQRQEAGRSVRGAIAELVKRLASAGHSICWLCWVAKYTPVDLNSDQFQAYDKEMHLLLSEIMAARAVVAALHQPSHDALSELTEQIYDLDARVGEAKSKYSEADQRSAALKLLADLHGEADQFDDDLLKAVAALPSSQAKS